MKLLKILVRGDISEKEKDINNFISCNYCFDNLYLNQGWPLRFDFAIFENGKVITLIECQGEQHYNKDEFFTDDSLLIRDNLKKKFCLENKIPLIEIPYYDYDKIDAEYLRRVMNL